MKHIYSTLFLLLIFIGNSYAQKTDEEIIFHNGQAFQKTTVVQSTSKITGVKSSVNVSSTSTVNSLYKVGDSTKAGYTFDFTIQKMTTDIESGGKKMSYNSEKPIDSTSQLEKALNLVVGKKILLTVNKNGVITKVDQDAATANIPSAVQSSIAKFTTGKVFDLNTSVPMNIMSKTGNTWTDSITTEGSSQVINYTVNSVAQGIATIVFSGVITGKTDFTSDDVETKEEFVMKTDGRFGINISTGIIENRTSNYNTTGKIETKDAVLLTSINSTTNEVVTKQ